MATDGVVTIQANLDAKNAEKELVKLNQQIEKLQRDLNKKTSSQNAIVKQMEEAEAEINRTKAKLNELYSDPMFDYSYSMKQSAKELEKQLKSQETVAKRIGDQYLKSAEEVDALTASIDETKEKAVAMEQQIAKENSGFNGLRKSAVELASQLTILKTVFGALKGVAQTVTKIFKTLANLCKTIFKWGSKVAKTLWTMFGTIGNDNGEGFAEALKNIKQIIKSLFGIRNLYSLIRKLESAIEECFEDLAQYSDDINEAISDVTSAFSQFKYAITSAISPLVTTFAPAISQLLKLCASAANELARITAMLTGQTSYTKANYVWEDYAESLEDASSASDKFLASFDTLEKISSSSSSDSDSSSLSEMFETVEVTPFDFSSWGEALDTFLDWLNDTAIPKIESALSTGVDWVNTLFGNLAEMFTYSDSSGTSVAEKAYEFGQNLAEKLNDAVSNISWSNIGTTIGAGLNVALNAAIGFIYAFNWYAFGNNLADAINNMISNIEWDKVGQWLWAKFKIAIETLAGIIANGDTGAWATAASDLIKSFYNQMKETISDGTIDWEQVGVKLREAVDGIDWDGIGYAMQGGIQAAFDAIEAMDLAGTLGDLLANIFNWAMALLLGDDSETVTFEDKFNNMLEDAENGIRNAGSTLSATNLSSSDSGSTGLVSQITDFVNRFIEEFSNQFNTADWEKLRTAISNGIEEAIDWLWNELSPTLLPKIKDIASEIGGAIWDGIVAGIKDALGLTDGMSIGSWLLSNLNPTTWGIKAFVKLTADDLALGYSDAGEAAGDGLLEGTESAIESGASMTAEKATSALTSALKSALEIHSPSALIGEEVGEPGGNGLLEYFANLFTDLTTWANEKVADPLVTSLKNSNMFSASTWSTFGKTAMSGLVDAFESGFNSIISGLNSLLSQVSSAMSQISSSMSTITGTSGLVLSSSTYSRLSSISLPALAEGAVIPPNREFMAVLGDQKSGTNIETPLNTMVEAFKQAMKEGDYGNSGNQTVVLEVDGTTLGTVVYNMNKKESRRIGTNLVTNR